MPTATARFDLKMDEAEKDLVSRAAALMGTTMASFVRAAAKEKAATLLERQTRVTMSKHDFDALMKALDAPFDDVRVTRGSGNLFIDLGFDPAEAEIMALRAEVMMRIEQRLKSQGWTQLEAARRLGITQPRVSKLIKGVWQDFSLDMLLTLAARAGMRPRLRLAA